MPALADEVRLAVEPLLEEVRAAGVGDPAVAGGAEDVPLQRRNPDVRNVVARRLLGVDLSEHHVVDVPVDVDLDLELRLEGLGEGGEVCRRLDAVEIDGPLLLRLADQCAPACRGQRRGPRGGARLQTLRDAEADAASAARTATAAMTMIIGRRCDRNLTLVNGFSFRLRGAGSESHPVEGQASGLRTGRHSEMRNLHGETFERRAMSVTRTDRSHSMSPRTAVC